MATGIYICLAVAGFSILLGLFLWFFGYRWTQYFRPTDTRTDEAFRLWAIGVNLVLLPLAAFGAYCTVTQQGNCLFEKVLEGSTTLVHDNQVSYNKEHITIEHPGVKHKILVWPCDDETPGSKLNKARPIVVALILINPSQKIVLQEKVECKEDGDASVSFTPDQAGDWDFRVTTSTPDVPKLHVYITDPKKFNGHRLPGY